MRERRRSEKKQTSMRKLYWLSISWMKLVISSLRSFVSLSDISWIDLITASCCSFALSSIKFVLSAFSLIDSTFWGNCEYNEEKRRKIGFANEGRVRCQQHWSTKEYYQQSEVHFVVVISTKQLPRYLHLSFTFKLTNEMFYFTVQHGAVVKEQVI